MTGDTIDEAYRYCESVTRRHAKSFYFAARFLPAAKRRSVFPIYAFCRHVDDEIDGIGEGDTTAAVASVERWKRNLEDVYEGRTPDAPDEGQREVFVAWSDLLRRFPIPIDAALDLVRGVLMDTVVRRYETFDDLYVYCYRVASTVGLMSSEILGYSDRSALDQAEAMGIAMQLTNIIRDVREDAAMGRIYLPAEDLRRFGVTEDQIMAGRMDARFVELMRFQVSRARDYYRLGEQGIGLLERDSRFTVLLAARIYARILDDVERRNYDVFSGRAHTTKAQKLLAMPRIWLEARRM